MNKKLALYKSRDFINRLKYNKFEKVSGVYEGNVYFKIRGQEKSEILIGIDINGCYDSYNEFFNEEGDINEERIEKVVKWLMLKKAVNWEDDKSSTRIKLREDNFVRYDGDTPIIILKNIDYMVIEDEMEKVSDNYLFEVYFLENGVTFNANIAEVFDERTADRLKERIF